MKVTEEAGAGAPFARSTFLVRGIVLVLATVLLGSCSGGSGGGSSTPPAPTNPVPIQTSFDLIDAAVANGTISPETALTYKVFAAFGDARLPAQFQGDEGDLIDAKVITELYERWPSLSPAAQETLEPFTVPPAYQGSWTSLPTAARSVPRTAPKAIPRTQAAVGRVQPQSLSVPICQQPQIDPNWAAKPATQDGRFKVWYDTRVAGMATKASTALAELETKIWPAVVGTAGMNAPLSDGSLDGCNGGDGRLDVYLIDGLRVSGANLGETRPDTWATQNFPTFIVIKPTLDDNEMKGTLAHEFTHASQWAYGVAALSVHSYSWLMESTAQAMIDIVYPNLPKGTTQFLGCTTLHFEQCVARHYFDTPAESLDDERLGLHRIYGSYLFFQFLSRTVGPTAIAQVWTATQTQSDQVMAVDAGIPGGFKDQWPKFAKLLWNQDPINTNSFDGWDALNLKPKLFSDDPDGFPVDMTGSPGVQWELNGDIKHLASHYYKFRIADPSIRSFGFLNHFQSLFPTDNPQVATQAFVRIGGAWQYQDWSTSVQTDTFKFFCLDVVAERVEQLVIVMSNRDPKNDISNLPIPPTLSASNVGCWRYAGSASVSTSGSSAAWPSFSQSGDGSVTLERFRPPQLPNGAPNSEVFQVLQGALTGQFNATMTGGCTLTQQANDNMTPGLASGSVAVKLGLDTGGGPIERDVTGAGTAQGMTHTVLSCPDVPDTTSDGQVSWDWLEIPGPADQTFVVLPNGNIQGTYTRNLSNGTSGTQTLIWNFTPLRQ